MAKEAYNGVNFVEVIEEIQNLGYGIDNRLGQNGIGLSVPGKRRRKSDGVILKDSFGETIPHDQIDRICKSSDNARQAALRCISYAKGEHYGGTNEAGKSLDQQVQDEAAKRKEAQSLATAILMELGLDAEKIALLKSGEGHVQKKPGPKKGRAKPKAETA